MNDSSTQTFTANPKSIRSNLDKFFFYLWIFIFTPISIFSAIEHQQSWDKFILLFFSCGGFLWSIIWVCSVMSIGYTVIVDDHKIAIKNYLRTKIIDYSQIEMIYSPETTHKGKVVSRGLSLKVKGQNKKFYIHWLQEKEIHELLNTLRHKGLLIKTDILS